MVKNKLKVYLIVSGKGIFRVFFIALNVVVILNPIHLLIYLVDSIPKFYVKCLSKVTFFTFFCFCFTSLNQGCFNASSKLIRYSGFVFKNSSIKSFAFLLTRSQHFPLKLYSPSKVLVKISVMLELLKGRFPDNLNS